MAYSFWKLFFIGQNLNHVHMTYSFLELLIFFWLTQVDIYCLEFISHHITEILYLNTKSKGNQSWNKNKHFHLFFHEIKTNIFNCFFNIKLEMPYEQSLFFSVSWAHFRKQLFEDVLQNRCSFLKISQYSELKSDSNRGAFLWVC